MIARTLRHTMARFADRESLRPDLGRGLRCMCAFMAPLLLSAGGKLPVELTFAALAAQSIALVDVRGAYSLRLTLLLAMTAILAGASGLGAFAAQPLVLALAVTVLIAFATGLWRHLSADYGPSMAASSTLLFMIALASRPGANAAAHHVVGALAGGLWGVLVQTALWPIRPQHPLRRAVADGWVAAADLFVAMAEAANPAKVAALESALRTALDKGYSALASAAPRPGGLVTRLEQLNFAGARLATRVGAFHSAMEALVDEPGYATFAPAFQPLHAVLANTARTVALAVVSRQPAHLATAEVRLRRLTNLLRTLRARLAAQAGDSPAWDQIAEILRQIEEHLPFIGETLRKTIDRAQERAAFTLELSDLHTATMRPLAAALNLSRRVDPALVRYTVRIAVLTVIGVALFKTHNLPHGYWLPFTMVVVLQPDYGSTRQRAAERLLGTLAGSVIGSLLLWLHPPLALLMAATASMSFSFGYFMKRNYGVAVIFITLFVVLLTESKGPVTIALTAERLGSTTVGGLLALLAAFIFWPMWEKDRFRPILAKAVRANADYLRVISHHLVTGGSYDRDVMQAKRRSETSNTAVFSSLQRMFADPKNRQDRIEQVAALANGNQRLTRALNLLALHLAQGAALPPGEIERFTAVAVEALEAIAQDLDAAGPTLERVAGARAALDALQLPSAAGPEVEDAPGPPHQHWVFTQLARAATELGAMLFALEAYRAEAADEPPSAPEPAA